MLSSLPLFAKYVVIFFISMVPIVELRGAIPIAESLGLNIFLYYPISIIGNILPVPFIYLFARKVLEWGKDKLFESIIRIPETDEYLSKFIKNLLENFLLGA